MNQRRESIFSIIGGLSMKKTLDYYMQLKYRMEIFQDEEGYALSFPELPSCITCAEALDGLMKEAIDAKETWISYALEHDIDIPEPSMFNKKEAKNIDNEREKRYGESLKNTVPVSLESLPNISLDLRGIIKYAKEKNMQVVDLTEEEKNRFIKKKKDNEERK